MGSITIRDKSDHKIFFAQDLLWALCNLDMEICVDSSEYSRPFLSNFTKISDGRCANSNEHCQYIDIIDQVDEINDNALQFPIISKNQAVDYNELRKNTKLKSLLPPLKNSDNEVNIGDSSWVIDLLLKKMGNDDLSNRKVLISAGPTRERFDPVRFLSNRSSGKMGIALARAAYIRGADVTLVLGPTAEKIPDYLNVKPIESAAEMAQTINDQFDKTDIYIGAAAIADYTPQEISPDKIKKNNGGFKPQFKRTVDVISSLNNQKRGQLLIGFSVETNNIYENSFGKLENKGLDLIIANNPNEKGAAFAGDTNKVSILHKNGKIDKLPLLSKYEVANIILDEILKLST
jgi:phosphopantothenoylcysteine synthetase/decarboxylase